MRLILWMFGLCPVDSASDYSSIPSKLYLDMLSCRNMPELKLGLQLVGMYYIALAAIYALAAFDISLCPIRTEEDVSCMIQKC